MKILLTGHKGYIGAVAVPMLLYWPATAIPAALQVKLSPTPSVVAGQVIADTLLSATATVESGTSPVCRSYSESS